MKVVHKQMKTGTVSELLEKAKELESSGEPEEAASLYQSIIKKDPLNEFSYSRLMVIYRKAKEFKKELSVIKSGLKAFLDYYKSQTKRSLQNPKVSRLSRSILKSTGLLDKKGNQLYQREPIGRWEKRRMLVEKKLRSV